MRLPTFAIMLPAILLCSSLALGVEKQDAKASAKRSDIKRLMELSGAGKLGVQVLNQMIDAFKQAKMGVPERFWKDFMSEVDPNDLVEMAIPSYDKHFTHEEIKQLIIFYESPAGQKLAKVQPQITQECMFAGQEWGRKLGEKVAKKLQEKGYN